MSDIQNVLAIATSPRRGGNTEILLDHMIIGMSEAYSEAITDPTSGARAKVDETYRYMKVEKEGEEDGE